MQQIPFADISPGDVLFHFFSFDDKAGGKMRPCVVVKKYKNAILVAKVTSSTKERENDVELQDWEKIGLIKKSRVRGENQRLLHKSENPKVLKIGRINESELHLVITACYNQYVKEGRNKSMNIKKCFVKTSLTFTMSCQLKFRRCRKVRVGRAV